MSVLLRRLVPRAQSVAIVALLSASFLAAPLSSSFAADAPAAKAAPQPGAAQSADAQTETVEQRIANLHTELKITASEEALWNNVAQAMRENAAAMEKLSAAKTLQAAHSMTAIDDLKGYENFAQAHVDGLKNLLASFETLYASFPDPQKKGADAVFQSFGQKGRASHT